MTRQLALQRIAAIVSTLAETNGSPESMLYLFCDMNMADYELIRDVLIKAGYVSIRGNFVSLTDTGKTTAEKINTAIARQTN